MDKTNTIRIIQNKFQMLNFAIDERTRRLWGATEAVAIGWGGISIVSLATELAHTTLRRGVRKLEGIASDDTEIDSPGKIRRSGAGRKKLVEADPEIYDALESLIDPVTRGDPESPLKWTCKSTRRLSFELEKQGY